MIFKFLRQYLWDDEFEQTKSQLVESQRLLDEYRTFIEKEKDKSTSDKEKVDPEFLTLLWGSIGIAIAVFVDTFQSLEKIKDDKSNFEYWVWVAVVVFTLYFIFRIGIIGVQLTNLYSTSKSDKRYKVFSSYFIIAAVLFIVIILLFFINNEISNEQIKQAFSA